MPTHAEKRRVEYSAEQMFDLAADVERYPEFLPWCVATRVRRREADTIVADMVIGFRMLREKFTSRATLDRPRRIDVVYENGPFKYLNSHWRFEPIGESACEIDFFIDFEFRTAILQRLMGMVFNEAVKMMVHSFEKRARQLYG